MYCFPVQILKHLINPFRHGIAVGTCAWSSCCSPWYSLPFCIVTLYSVFIL